MMAGFIQSLLFKFIFLSLLLLTINCTIQNETQSSSQSQQQQQQQQMLVRGSHHQSAASSSSNENITYSLPIITDKGIEPVSVYNTFESLFQSLNLVRLALSNTYHELVRNDSTVLSNWLAYSELLKPINSALLDNLFPILTNDEMNITNDCFMSILDFAQAFHEQQSWAYRLLDSSGNIFPSGFMSGSFNHLGDFDQCVETTKSISSGYNIEGKYCLLKYGFHVPTNKTRLLSQDVVFNTSGTALQNTFFADFLKYGHVFKVRSARIGICLPSLCSQEDLQTMVNHFLKVDKVTIRIDSCQTLKEYGQLSSYQVAIFTALLILVCIAILATIVEVCHYRSHPKALANCDMWGKILLSFSLYGNTKSLLSTRHTSENLRSINGIRVLTMCWLVYAHAYFLSIKESFRSSSKFIESIYDLKMYFILNAWPAVEVFFIISALLHSYHVFKALSTKGTLNIPKLIINRIARLWPSLWLIVGLVFLVPSIAQGPLWPDVMHQQVDNCFQHWWKIPLFVSNFRSCEETCQIHTWYLSVDTQLFIVSFVFIYLIYKYKKRALIYSVLMAILVCAGMTVLFNVNHQVPTILFNNIEERQIYEDMANVYMPTYYHFTPYLVGIITGYQLMLAKKNQSRINKSLNFILWIVSVFVAVSIILSGYIFTAYPASSPIFQSLYAGFHRLAWSICVSYLIFSCETQQGGLFTEFLSHPMFVPLSRLSYLVYLLHFIVTWTRTAYLRSPLVFSNYTLLNEFIVNLVFSLVLAFIFYLLVEAPFNKLYNTFVGKHNWLCVELNMSDNKQINQTDQTQVDMESSSSNNRQQTSIIA